MPDVMRRMLLGGALASLALPALCGDAQALRPRWPARMRLRPPQPPVPEDVANPAYHDANAAALAGPAGTRRVVLMGDSITYNWGRWDRSFLAAHGILGRGIGGETCAQMLLRFSADVIALKPKAVHIMGGTNDIAALRHPYDPDVTRRSLDSMAAQAKENGICVVMASVPPASGFYKRPGEDPMQSLKSLNAWIHDLCERAGYTYCDYWPVLRGPEDRLSRQYGRDTVHPNKAGYAVMEPVLLAAIDRALKPQAGSL